MKQNILFSLMITLSIGAILVISNRFSGKQSDIDAVPKYGDLSEEINFIPYHFEMANVYNSLSINPKRDSQTDDGISYYFAGMDKIALCVMLAHTFENQNLRYSVTSSLLHFLNDIQNPRDGLSYRTLNYYENFGEVLYSDDAKTKSDKHTRRDIETYLGEAVNHFESAEKWYGAKNESELSDHF